MASGGGRGAVEVERVAEDDRHQVVLAQGDAAVRPVLPLAAAAVDLDQAADPGGIRSAGHRRMSAAPIHTAQSGITARK